ncbi:MAG TPA: VanW family protein [Syntrophomonadaceae bacterium]|nr:VanW family protein [Syntrophomonadaceae bacterium]
MRTKIKRGLVYLLMITAGIAVAQVLYFYQFFYQNDHFLPGVAIASMPVGGQHRNEAISGIEAHFADLYRTPVTFYYQDFNHVTTLGELAEKVDINQAIEEIWERERQRSIRSKLLNLDGSHQIAYAPPIRYKQAVLEMLAEEWNEILGQPPVNPQLEIDRTAGMVIVPGKDGKQVNIEATWERMPKEWAAIDELRIPIVLEKVYPSISEEDLKVMGELASYSTWYNSGEVDRTHNLVKAANAINGRVVKPGETFSFNRTVGARTFETGYRDAMVIVSGRFEPGVGGGICQVSSTLYNAVLLADLEVVERHNHSLAVAYVPVGLDATVAYGIQDFQFKNNTGHPVYIRAVAGGGRLTVTIYGHLSHKKRVEVSSVIDKVIPFEEIRQVDPNLEPGQEKIEVKGNPGYVARSFKRVYDKNGELAQQVQLATDYYKPLNTLIYTGPELSVPLDFVDTSPEPPAVEENPDDLDNSYSNNGAVTDPMVPSDSGEGNE